MQRNEGYMIESWGGTVPTKIEGWGIQHDGWGGFISTESL